MRKIKFAWLPTRTLDGLIWLRWYKHYISINGSLKIPIVPKRRDYEPGDVVGGYGP